MHISTFTLSFYQSEGFAKIRQFPALIAALQLFPQGLVVSIAVNSDEGKSELATHLARRAQHPRGVPARMSAPYATGRGLLTFDVIVHE